LRSALAECKKAHNPSSSCRDPPSTNHAPNIKTTGTNERTRKAAGQQICDIARAHPPQLPSIVRKVGLRAS
jgi:hypothetical protein